MSAKRKTTTIDTFFIKKRNIPEIVTECLDPSQIGTIYILKFVLPILANISRCFQAGVVSFAKIIPTLDYAKDKLDEVASELLPIKMLIQDLKTGGRLDIIRNDLQLSQSDETRSLPTTHQEKELTSFLHRYVSALKDNIDARFKESSPILDAFRVFDVLVVPDKSNAGFIEYGNQFITRLGDHYLEPDDCQQLSVEWQKAKYDLLHWRDEVPSELKDGQSTSTASEWCLSRLMQPDNKRHYPLLSYIAELCMTCPVSNAWPERGASTLKWLKHRLRSRMKNDLLGTLMHIRINGPKHEQEMKEFISEVISAWLKEKERRKLSRSAHFGSTLSQVDAIDATLSQSQEAAQSQSQEAAQSPQVDAIDATLSQSQEAAQSPQVDMELEGYVAALQLPAANSVDMGDIDSDSDYESEFSDLD